MSSHPLLPSPSPYQLPLPGPSSFTAHQVSSSEGKENGSHSYSCKGTPRTSIVNSNDHEDDVSDDDNYDWIDFEKAFEDYGNGPPLKFKRVIVDASYLKSQSSCPVSKETYSKVGKIYFQLFRRQQIQ